MRRIKNTRCCPGMVDSVVVLVCLQNVVALLLLEKGLETWVSNTLCDSLNDWTTIYLESDHAAWFFSSSLLCYDLLSPNKK